MCRGCYRRKQGGGRREGLPASSQWARKRSRKATVGLEGGTDVCREWTCLGEESGVQGQLGNNKGWEKPGDRGDRREGVAGG